METEAPKTEYVSLEAEQWRELTSGGICIPTLVNTSGVSMYPLTRARGDSVIMVPLQRELMKGDIVVFLRDDGKYVAHRVSDIRNDLVRTIGDNNEYYDKIIYKSDILGLVTHINRGKRKIYVDTPFWRWYGLMTQKCVPIRKFFKQNIRRPLARLLKGTK